MRRARIVRSMFATPELARIPSKSFKKTDTIFFVHKQAYVFSFPHIMYMYMWCVYVYLCLSTHFKNFSSIYPPVILLLTTRIVPTRSCIHLRTWLSFPNAMLAEAGRILKSFWTINICNIYLQSDFLDFIVGFIIHSGCTQKIFWDECS